MRREKSLRNGVQHANGVVWEPVYRTHLRRENRDADRLDHEPRARRVDVVRVVLRQRLEAERQRGHDDDEQRERGEVPRLFRRLRVVPYERISGWSSKASDGVERRRGRGLKPRGGRRETTAKVLEDRRSPRQRGRMGTSV